MRFAATILLAFLLAAADARAATVSVSGATLHVTAAPGEANQLAIAPGTGVLSITDAGAPLQAGSGCATAGAAVECASLPLLGVTADLGDGDDTLTSTAALPLLVTDGAGADRVTGGSAADTFLASPGADAYHGGGGSDLVSYAARADAVIADVDNVADDGAAGENDNVRTDVERIAGGSAGDTLTGDGSSEELDGGPGTDALNGNGGNDRFSGGEVLNGGSGTDTADFSARTDALVIDLEAFESVENATGGSGSDRLLGTGAANQLLGGAGDDVLDGRTGADRLEGGPGTDTADYSSRTAPVVADLDGGADDGQSLERDRITTDVERLIGGTAGDALTGDDDPNLLIGGLGSDRLDGNGAGDALDGGDGDDVLDGDAGDDVLDGSSGADTVNGGHGNDHLVGAAGGDALNGGEGDDALAGGDGNDRIDGAGGADGVAGETGDDDVRGGAGVDRVSGGDGNDAVAGGFDDDVLAGGPGADELSGDEGWDTADYAGRPERLTIDLDDQRDDGAAGEGDNVRASVEAVIGGAGRDRITGNAGSNHLYGEGGGDRLDGGDGSDRLFGGAGRDTIIGGKGGDSMDGGDGADRIAARDGSREGVRCGGGRDRATTDTVDMLFGCEKRTGGTANWTQTGGGKAGRVRGVRARTGGGRFVDIPGFPGERIDRRLLADIAYLRRRYRVHITDGFARSGHARGGEHPIGLAVDIVPGPGGSWSDVDRLAKWAEPRQNRPRSPFRWVGYNGDRNHGRGNHLHLSWSHTATRPGRPARTVWTLSLSR